MATLLLSAAGAAIGGGFGGTVLGLSGAVIGRAVGATLGRAIDQRLLGSGSGTVEMGRVDRLRLTSASEGDAVGLLWGRVRIGGQVIWATRFLEHVHRSGSGKGAPRPPTASYSYSVSLAVALCEGEILRVGRIWADGTEIDPATLTMRVYPGSEDQLPDPKIAAVEGGAVAPGYRGIAYVVFEDLDLTPFGNRVPQFTFEVVRPAQGEMLDAAPDLSRGIEAVALIPGTGEYALATTSVSMVVGSTSPAVFPANSSIAFLSGVGLTAETRLVNRNAPGDPTDFARSLQMLNEELPRCGAVSLVVSWFGDDLRCGQCRLRPKVEQAEADGREMAWKVSGLSRAAAQIVVSDDSGAVYGGTPADASVLEAIAAMKAAGKAVTFYPFILMEQLAGNALPDPWSDEDSQPPLPWRGRITLSVAPERDGSPDRSAVADAQVAAFFGAAQPGDFAPASGTVTYSGPAEWSYRRFILHYAHLCAMAGGVDAFCIGSEMRALTRIRGAGDTFPAVAALRQLAAEVKAILGPECKIGYAADWSEYFGYQTAAGDRYFHLDPLWADPAIDFIGIDNYMPLSDWREGETHLDAHWGSIYALDYLEANIEGGEGYDWYYSSQEHRDAQIRTPITDGAHDEAWIWRFKDIRNWWSNLHHERIGGVRQDAQTAWLPGLKPVWFTEFGCAAIDKGTNQPNKFLDPKSSESALPWYSSGRRDDLIQMQYLRAMLRYWNDPAHNPLSDTYGGRMIDMSRAHVWAWDARPYPAFPDRADLWSDAGNYRRGHWLNGRDTAQPLSNVVAEICTRAGLRDFDTSGLYGLVRGYLPPGGISARGALQALSLGYGFDALERDGKVVFRMRDASVDASLLPQDLALDDEARGLQLVRAPEAEMAGRVRLSYIEADGRFETRAVEAILPDEEGGAVAASELALALTRSEAQQIVARWLAEARVARDTARFTLPPSMGALGPGDVVRLQTDEGARRYRIDRVERAEALSVEAVRVERQLYEPSEEGEDVPVTGAFSPPVPVTPVFLDLPLMTGAETPHAPHLAVAAAPWPEQVAVYGSSEDAGYDLNCLIGRRSVIGQTLTPLAAARPGLWDRGAPLRVRMVGGNLASASLERVLAGQNALAIGDGSSDRWEVLQFVQAELVETRVWDLSLRRRGQLGTDAVMPAQWPAGSVVVALDGNPAQINLTPNLRNQARHYRIGSAQRGYDDPSYVHTVQAFAGIGLRPYSPSHLRAVPMGAGWRCSWIRRTRIDGDGWEGLDVPLGEAMESYLVRVLEGTAIRREAVVSTPVWTYTAEMMAADGVTGPFGIAVAQVSEVFGPGLFAQIAVAG